MPLWSLLWIVGSLVVTALVAIVSDLSVLQRRETYELVVILAINATTLLSAGVGSIIELRRPGHRIGRLLMVAGPLYGLLALGWDVGASLENVVGRDAALMLNWLGIAMSWAGISLIAGWLPLLFPTGSLPGPRWRLPVAILAGLGTAGVLAAAVRPGPMAPGIDMMNPVGIEGWPAVLQPLVDSIAFTLFAFIGLAVASLISRYRHGDAIERLQVRWLAAAVAVIALGGIGNAIENLIRDDDDGYFVSALVFTAGFLLMPLAIGIAVLRYKLYDIDRIISRTVGWAIVSGVLVTMFATLILGSQALLSGVTQGQTLAVAASTLVTAALFAPVRTLVQRAVDRRFNRSRVNADEVAAGFAGRLRDRLDLATVSAEVDATVRGALAPRGVAIWVRPQMRGHAETSSNDGEIITAITHRAVP